MMEAFRKTTSREDMISFAKQFGMVQTVTWPMDYETNKHKNFMFVRYKNRRDAFVALQQSGKKKVRKRRSIVIDALN